MKIYIDQGHNPQNPDAGIEANGYREQDLTYEIGIQLEPLLKARGLETRLSRNTKTTQLGNGKINSVSARINDANTWGADLFISLHTGISSDPFATGSSCFVPKPSSDLMSLAKSIAEKLHLVTKIQNRGVNIKSDYSFLRKTNMPSLVVEMGFITNKNDADSMSETPTVYALGVANGIFDYVNSISPNILTQSAVPEPFFQLYPDNCNKKCRLYIDVYTENKRNLPISNATVTVYRGFDGKRTLIYRCQTDYSGHTIPIELPIYNEGKSNKQEFEMFCINVQHPDFLAKNYWINIENEETIRQSISMTAKQSNRYFNQIQTNG